MMSHTTIKITTMSRVTDTLADFGCRGDGQHDSQQWDISYTKQGSGVRRRRSTHAIDYLFSHGQITVKKKPTESPLSTDYPRKQPFLPVGHQPPEAMDSGVNEESMRARANRSSDPTSLIDTFWRYRGAVGTPLPAIGIDTYGAMFCN
jgi:hypothetical protein